MECNKDEAMRAKEIAEKNFTAKDFEGAKKFALKAQNLYPGLDGLPHMLATFDVYICASSKTNDAADTDWYKILGVNPSADDETIKKHYKKLALMLHPDKNKSIGAEGAFQLISEAQRVLSDKSRRALYDQKRNPELFSQKNTPIPVRKAPPAANGSHDFSKSSVFSARVNKNASRADSTGKSKEEKSDTFWTFCAKCNLQFQYLRVACNHHLLCQNCSNSFIAFEIPAPSAYGGKRNLNLQSAGNNTGTSYDISAGFGNSCSAAKVSWTPFLRTGAPNVARAPSTAQKTYEDVVREFEEALAAAKKQDQDKKRKSDSSQKKMSGASATNHMNFAKKSGTSATNHMNSAKKRKVVKKSHGIKKLSQIDISNILVKKARKVVRKKTGSRKPNSVKNKHAQ